MLLAHATGFHGPAYLPVADGLTPRFHTFGLDFRGHGDTEVPPGWQVDWQGYGDDALAVADAMATMPGGEHGLITFGHSMGGAALLMAAHRRPSLFRLIVLFEPIAYPPTTRSPIRAGGGQPPRGRGEAAAGHVPVDRGRHRQLRLQASPERLRPGRPGRLRALRLRPRPGRRGRAPEVRARVRGPHVRARAPAAHRRVAGRDPRAGGRRRPVGSSRTNRRSSPRTSPTPSPTAASCSRRTSITSGRSPIPSAWPTSSPRSSTSSRPDTGLVRDPSTEGPSPP